MHKDTDLADLESERLAKAFPELLDTGFPVIAGLLEAQLSDTTLSENTEPVFNTRIELNRGRLAFPETGAVENIVLESEVTAAGLDLKSLSADWGGGHLASSANIDWHKAPFMKGVYQIALSGVDLIKAVPPPANSRDPSVSGVFSTGLRGDFSGTDSESMTRALTGDGQILIKDGVITNLNILREVLNKLSIIPGVSEKIQSRLSQEYLAKLQERDTRLEDVNIPVRVKDGFVLMDSIVIQSDTLRLNGQVQTALAGPLNGRLFAAIDKEFSLALMRSVSELGYIADQNGQITIPITMRGTLQKPEIIPEVQQLASRLAVGTTQELLSGFLNKKKPGDAQTANGTAGQSVQQPGSSVDSSQQSSSEPVDPFAALLGQVLQAATKKKE